MQAVTTSCPCCGSTAYHVEARRAGLTYGRCAECDLAYLHPATSDGLALQVENESTPTDRGFMEALVADESRREKVARTLLPRRLEFYTRLLERKPERVLEVGCAEGTWGKLYQDAGVEWTGLEVDPRLAKLAKRNGVRVTRSSFLEYESETRHDVVFASQVLEHFLDPNAFVAKARSLLVPGGVLHVDVPNQGSLQAVLKKHDPRGSNHGFLEFPHHAIAFTKPALGALLRKHGFDVEFLEARASDDSTWGQLGMRADLKSKLLYRFMDLIGRGSLLVAVGRLEDRP